jgi:hypothetical protein
MSTTINNPPEAPSSQDEEPFDPLKAVAEITDATPNIAGRKLPFSEQCAAFACLYAAKYSQKLIAKVFGVGPDTVSHLAGCLKRDPRPYDVEPGIVDGQITDIYTRYRDMNRNRNKGRIQRYRRVADEFERLGENEFFHRYYTREIHARMTLARRGFNEEAGRRARRGPNPEANSGRGVWQHPIDPEYFRVEWLVERITNRPGWYYSPCNEKGRPVDERGFFWLGRDRVCALEDDFPFPTSEAAKKAAEE